MSFPRRDGGPSAGKAQATGRGDRHARDDQDHLRNTLEFVRDRSRYREVVRCATMHHELRRPAWLGLTLAVVLASCIQVEEPSDDQATTAISAAVLTGRVTDWQTGEAISDAKVSTYEGGALTDSAGWFRIERLRSEMQWLTVRRRDYISHRAAVRMPPGDSLRLDVFLARSTHTVECPLAGDWDVDLVVDSVGAGPPPGQGAISGVVSLRNELYQEPQLRTEEACDVNGEHQLPLNRFRPGFLDDTPSHPATSATLSDSGTVWIKIGGGADSGVSLGGTFAGDSVIGRWTLLSYSPHVFGHFTMKRVDDTPRD